MRTVVIGDLNTRGEIVVSDPGYGISDMNVNLKVKPGTYQVSVLVGKLKNPIFEWDKIPGNKRIFDIQMIHKDHVDNVEFKRTKKNVSVDSGQAGFFNKETFAKDFNEPVSLKKELWYFFRERRTSKILERREFEMLLDSYDELKDKNSEVDMKVFYKRQIEGCDFLIKHFDDFFEKGIIPHWHKIEHEQSLSFYEVICDLNRSKYYSGVLDNKEGAVAMSGNGDGVYAVEIAKDNKQIIGVKIKFLSLKEGVKN